MQLPKCVPNYSSVIAERVWEEGDTECWQWLPFPSMLAWHFLLTQGQLFSLYVTWA